MVYETSEKLLTLCYEFIDDSDRQLDFICVEDLLQTIWTPVTSSFLQQSTVNSVKLVQKQDGLLLLFSLISVCVNYSILQAILKQSLKQNQKKVARSVKNSASPDVILSNISNTKHNIVNTPKANVVVKRKASFESVYGLATSIFNQPALADGVKRTRKNIFLLLQYYRKLNIIINYYLYK